MALKCIPDQWQPPHQIHNPQKACREPYRQQFWGGEHETKDFIYQFLGQFKEIFRTLVEMANLARGAMPLALPNSYPCILTGMPLFPAAIAAVWLIQQWGENQYAKSGGNLHLVKDYKLHMVQ